MRGWSLECLVFTCVLGLASACSAPEARLTQVLVAVDADDDVARSLSRVEIETYSVDGELAGSLSYAVNSAKSGPGTVRFPFSVGVVKRSLDRFLVVVTGYAGEEPVIERKALAVFIPNQVRALGVFLDSPCFGKLCGDPRSDTWLTLTCRVSSERGAQCESVELEETVSVAVGTELDAALSEPRDAGAEPVTADCDAQSCADSCTEDAVRCVDEQRLQRCDASGRWQSDQLCINGCRPGATACATCTAGVQRCEGRQPQICRQDGSAWVDNGETCDRDCVDGRCPTCSPGATPRCRGTFVEQCSSAGAWEVQTECAGATPACVQGECLACEPNAELCIGSTRQICDAEGSAWAKQNVGKDVCGAECNPGTKRCFAQVFQRCDATGDWSEPAFTVGECGVVCVAGEQGCAGTRPRTCNSDGTAWDNQPVKKGACNAECDPGSGECNGTQSRTCSASGLWSSFAITAASCGATCAPGNVRCADTTPQVCNGDGTVWTNQAPQAGTCDCRQPAPPGFGGNCGSCGGKVQCNGSCSVATPANFGQSCGNCGGTVRCDGTCSVATPASYGQACGNCGGTVQCDGTCSVATPSTFGQSCGSCNGTVRCDGTCSASTPPTLGQSCGSCGGQVQCDGGCSVATPGDLGQPCGDCGGVRLCGGGCSVVPGGSCSGFCCDRDTCGRCVECIRSGSQACR